MHCVKINDEKVVPISVPKLKPNKIKGYELFPELYSNIYLCAKKKSGKSSAINKILTNCADKHTALIFFASTIHKDDTLRAIVKKFKKKGNPVMVHTSIKEEKVDKLKEFLDTLKCDDSDDDDEKKEPAKYIEVDSDDDDKPRRKPKKLAPEMIFVFDDLGDELRIPSVNQLLKTNRHYKCKVIISSQYPNDLTPQALKQMDYCILFGGHSQDKLEIFFNHYDLHIPFTQFCALYNDATSKKYNFLYIDRNDQRFRKNFNCAYQ